MSDRRTGTQRRLGWPTSTKGRWIAGLLIANEIRGALFVLAFLGYLGGFRP
jgi:hypothetical protein